jgi:hypothetical protein
MDYGKNAHLDTNYIFTEDKNRIDPSDFGVSKKYELARNEARKTNSKTYLHSESRKFLQPRSRTQLKTNVTTYSNDNLISKEDADPTGEGDDDEDNV